MYVYALQHLAVYIIYIIYKQLALEGILLWLKHWTGNTKVLARQFQISTADVFLHFSDIGWVLFILLCASCKLCFVGFIVLFWSDSFIAAITPVAVSVLSDVCHQSQVTCSTFTHLKVVLNLSL